MRTAISLCDLINTVALLGEHLQPDVEDKSGHATFTQIQNNKTKQIKKQRGLAWKVVDGMKMEYQHLLDCPEVVTKPQ